MQIHRNVIIEHIKETNKDYHIFITKYELHKNRDSILCTVNYCKKGEYVFDIKKIRVMYEDYNLTLRKHKLKELLK